MNIFLYCCQRIIIVIKFCRNSIPYLFFVCVCLCDFLMCFIKHKLASSTADILKKMRKRGWGTTTNKKWYIMNWSLFCFKVYYIMLNKKKEKENEWRIYFMYAHICICECEMILSSTELQYQTIHTATSSPLPPTPPPPAAETASSQSSRAAHTPNYQHFMDQNIYIWTIKT